MSRAPGAIHPFGPWSTSRPDLLVPVRFPELGQAGHQFGRPGPGTLEAQRGQPAADRFVGELAEPVRRLHQVAVGVEYRSVHWAPRQVRVVVASVDPRRLPDGAIGTTRPEFGPPSARITGCRPVPTGPASDSPAATRVTDNIYPSHNFL